MKPVHPLPPTALMPRKRIVLIACAALLAFQRHSRAEETVPPVDSIFVQLCDPQLGMTDYKEDICAFEQAVKQINLLAPAFVLLCGDMVHKPSPTSLSDFRKIAEALAVPCRYVPGNHDLTLKTPGDMLAEYRAIFGPDYHGFTHGGARFIVINTDLMKRPSEGETPRMMQWIETELAGAKAAGLSPVLAGHHPPFFHTADEADLYQNIPLAFRKTLLEWCAAYGVKTYLSGHTHCLAEHRHGGTLVLSGESTSKNIDGRPRGFRLWRMKNGIPQTHQFVPLYLRRQISPKPPYDAALETGSVAQCLANLRWLDAAKEFLGMQAGIANGETLDPDRVWRLIPGGRASFKCAEGGRYELGPMGCDPACTTPGHALPYFHQFEEYRVRAGHQSALRGRLATATMENPIGK